MLVRWVVFLCVAAALPLAAQSPNITGTWTGQTTEPANPLKTVFGFEMDLIEAASGAVTGTTLVSADYNGSHYFALFSLTGQFANGVLTFQDGAFLSGTPPPAGVPGWCDISGIVALTTGTNSSTLSGPWQAPGCPGGVITVTRATSLQTTGAVVNGASFQDGLCSDAWITIRGSNLAFTSRTWQLADFVNGALPTSLDGVRVTINGRAAYVYYISPGQINALAPPDGATGPVLVQVFSPQGSSNTVTVNKQIYAPALFTYSQNQKYAVAEDALTYAYLAPAGLLGNAAVTRPAMAGENVTIYATGLGQTNPPFAEGQVIQVAQPVAASVQLLVGNVSAKVLFAGIIAPGLYQINFVVPNLPKGDAAVVINVGGVASSNQIFLAIQ